MENISLTIREDNQLDLKATFCGPPGASVWARAWVSDEENGYDETASPALSSGTTYVLSLHPVFDSPPAENLITCVRIESSPLATEHVVLFPLGHYLQHT